MTEKVLFVDDEQNVLDGIQRQLRKEFHIETALGPEQGLASVTNQSPYAIIVSDLRMPGMDGIEFLARVRKLSPDSVRMMLTGNADLQTAIQAVNEGNVFRFLTKPCAPDALAKALMIGIDQYRLITAERELLGKTLKGSIKVLTELLAMLNPEAFGRSSRIKRYVREISTRLAGVKGWQIETAAMLSQIGCVTLPDKTLQKFYRGEELTPQESQLIETHSTVASDLLSNIPRMEKVAEIVVYQEKHFDGSGFPRDSRRGAAIPLGARILKVALDFDKLTSVGVPKRQALGRMERRAGYYDPAVLKALKAAIGLEDSYIRLELGLSDLSENMFLDQNLKTREGQLLITKGEKLSEVVLRRLRNFAQTVGIEEPIAVMVQQTTEKKTVPLEPTGT